jgi:hypothetical protein
LRSLTQIEFSFFFVVEKFRFEEVQENLTDDAETFSESLNSSFLKADVDGAELVDQGHVLHLTGLGFVALGKKLFEVASSIFQRLVAMVNL